MLWNYYMRNITEPQTVEEMVQSQTVLLEKKKYFHGSSKFSQLGFLWLQFYRRDFWSPTLRSPTCGKVLVISPSPASNYQCYFSHYCRMTLIRPIKVSSITNVAMILQAPLRMHGHYWCWAPAKASEAGSVLKTGCQGWWEQTLCPDIHCVLLWEKTFLSLLKCLR